MRKTITHVILAFIVLALIALVAYVLMPSVEGTWPSLILGAFFGFCIGAVFYILAILHVGGEIESGEYTGIASHAKPIGPVTTLLYLSSTILILWLFMLLWTEAFAVAIAKHPQLLQTENWRAIDTNLKLTFTGIILLSSTMPMLGVSTAYIAVRSKAFSFWICLLSILLTVGVYVVGNFAMEALDGTLSSQIILDGLFDGKHQDVPFAQNKYALGLLVLGLAFGLVVSMALFMWIMGLLGRVVFLRRV